MSPGGVQAGDCRGEMHRKAAGVGPLSGGQRRCSQSNGDRRPPCEEWSNPGSGTFPLIVFQEPTEPLAANNCAFGDLF